MEYGMENCSFPISIFIAILFVVLRSIYSFILVLQKIVLIIIANSQRLLCIS